MKSLTACSVLASLLGASLLTAGAAHAQTAPKPADPKATEAPKPADPKAAEPAKPADPKPAEPAKVEAAATPAPDAAKPGEVKPKHKDSVDFNTEVEPSKKKGLKTFEIGFGFFGAGGVIGLTKPGTNTIKVGGIEVKDSSYPGFFGGTGGVGLAIDARFLESVGLEVDFYYGLSEKGKGDYTITASQGGAIVGQQTFKIQIGQSALHVPILVKGTLPFGSVRPFLGLGVDVVVPGTPEATVTPAGLQTALTANAAVYVLPTIALGFEVRLPIKQVDIRIPFSLRFMKNFSTGDTIDSRRDITLNGTTITKISYKSEWEFQGLATLGASIYF
jgi:hypothetical protein